MIRPAPSARGAGGLDLAPRRPIGLRFTERMTGTVDGVGPLALTLTVLVDDLHRFLRSPRHDATFFGTAHAEAQAQQPLTVTGGRLRLLTVDANRVRGRRMTYRAWLVTSRGDRYRLVGRKFIGRRPPATVPTRGAWGDFTRLQVTIFAAARGGRVTARRGTLSVTGGDFARQLRTLRVTNAAGVLERLDGLLELGRFFGGIILDTYAGPFARAAATCDAPAVRRRSPRPSATPTQCYPVIADDGVRIGLRRYVHGDRGPVLLSPGFGMSSRCFWLDTIGTNLVDYLCKHKYDVWCLDYRASPDFRGAGRAFSIDDIACRDYPAAVATVLRESAPADGRIQAVVHCVGAMSFLMALLEGAVPAGMVRSVVCSQLGLHPITPSANWWKAQLRLASLLRLLGERRLDADYDERRWSDWSMDKALRWWPGVEPCTNGACPRITFMFGETYRHAALNLATHESIQDIFGLTSLAAFEHLALMIRRGHAVNRYGENAYLPNVARLTMPISFIHGKENREFLPKSTETTVAWLQGSHPRARCRHVPIPDYGHLDCIIGRRAHVEVFPMILDQLENPP